jgi:oxygen-independent coproporphyrinogen-3 oxidase
MQDGVSLYVHVPFCLSKCPYCDFNTYQGIESQFDDYLGAVVAEIAGWSRALGGPTLNTIFLGGGTPSYLPDGEVARILDAVGSAYPSGWTRKLRRNVTPTI